MASLISPLISVVVKKAADSLTEKICQMWGLEDSCKKLTRQLLAVQEKIADAEKHALGSPAVQMWMKELDAAAHEAEDVLDDFQYEALRQEAISQHQLLSASAMVVKDLFSNGNPILFRQKISNRLTKILQKIDEIVNEMNKFNFVPHDPVPLIDRETHSFVIESEVIGRDGERDEIVSALLDPQRERDNISVLPIVGMGGLGKTTLAQFVYNHERVQRHFQLFMWVCVSTEFNINTIIKSIIQIAKKEVDLSMFSKEVLQQQLRETLNKKKYLLVLDDVWTENREKWDELKTLLFYGASPGSVVIVTTRSKGVASIMGTMSNQDLASLSEEDSWRLFKKRAFVAEIKESSEELIAIGKRIVRKCRGLPLVVKAMGGLLGTMPDVYDWRAIVDNKVWESLTSSENILAIIKLSYDYLPSHTKQCFAFCAVFQQDYIMERDILIQLWMANDFIPSDGTTDLEYKGRCIFNELYRRSFFQDIEEKETHYGSIITCKMHDIMHDLAREIVGKKCSASLEKNYPKTTQEDVYHLLLDKPSKNIANILKQFPIIRTCWAHSYERPSKQSKEHSYLPKSNSLRVLRFGFLMSPPKELRYMTHLRYLDLYSTCHILPTAISRLYNLQTLKLDCYNLRELPNGMRYMINLRHIFLDNCPNLKWMPIDLGQLKFLQTLTRYVVNPDRGGSIVELKNLNLYGHLSLSGLEKIRDIGDAEAARISEKCNLCSLELQWDSTKTTRNGHAILKACRPHTDLKVLNIAGYGGSNFSKWMKESITLNNLKRLSLIECINCEELPPVWQLPLLENLCLVKMDCIISIICGTYKNADGSEPLITFPSLKVLKMYDMPNLENLHERNDELVTFPNLNTLRIYKCPKLNTVPLHVPLLVDLDIWFSNKIKLCDISNLPMLSNLYITADTPPPADPDVFRPPKSLKVMMIHGFENVNPLEEDDKRNCQENSLYSLTIRNSNCFFSRGQSRLSLGFWKHFKALKKLDVRDCDALVHWPVEEFKILNCLKTLRIDHCKSFTGSLLVSSSLTTCGEDSLPQLESLELNGCPELVEVHGCYSSLEKLRIEHCAKFSGEGLIRLTNLSELKHLKLWNCPNLRALPDNMGHLPSLEHLTIDNCPGIESFPKGLQERLPSLQSLTINQCPALGRLCRRGGDYWHLVSPIPETDFWERESTLRRFVRGMKSLSPTVFFSNGDN